MNCCPRPFVLPCSSTRRGYEHRDHVAGGAGSRPHHRDANPDTQRHTVGEIDADFAILARERPDALFVGANAFFASRRVQFVNLTARDRIPAAYTERRKIVAAGGLMSYGTNIAERYRQVGVYTGSILKGAKPADLPVVQSTKFEFVINLGTARALGVEVPPSLLATADEVID